MIHRYFVQPSKCHFEQRACRSHKADVGARIVKLSAAGLPLTFVGPRTGTNRPSEVASADEIRHRATLASRGQVGDARGKESTRHSPKGRGRNKRRRVRNEKKNLESHGFTRPTIRYRIRRILSIGEPFWTMTRLLRGF